MYAPRTLLKHDLTIESRTTVARNEKSGHLLVDNAYDGFDLFSLPDHTWLKHFPTAVRTFHCPVQVAFAEDGTAIVGGSDCGVVYVFNLDEGTELARLRHATCFVPKVTVSRMLHIPLHLVTMLYLDSYIGRHFLDHRREW